MYSMEEISKAMEEVKFSSTDLRLLGLMCRDFKSPPSAFLGIEDKISAIALDMCCAREMIKHDEKQQKENIIAIADVIKQQKQAFAKFIIAQIIEDIKNRGELYNLIVNVVENAKT